MRKEIAKGLKVLVIAVCLVAIAGGLTFLFYRYYAVVKVIKYDAYLIVSDKIGFDVSKDYIHFGIVKPGGSASKHIILSNIANRTFKIQTKVSGDLTNMVSFDFGKSREIYPGENKTVSFSVKVPPTMPYGNYTGRIEFIFRRF